MTSGAVTYLFRSLVPALVISMGYIDLGKWLAAVEGGARFGYDLALLVLFFNLTAIFCQYLAACIGTVTGRDLAKICKEEYSESTCFMLGAQAEFSLISSDVTRIIGIAHGLNLLLGVDFFVCMCFSSGFAILLPYLVTALGSRLAEASYASLAGLAFLFYVLGVLISQPEIPLATNIFFPKLNSENIYLLMALLGANIISHNFYVHSAMVHQQKRITNVPMDALFHDHFFAILLIFSGIFLVNYVLMNSAAVTFSITDAVLNSQDISMLIDQIFGTPVAPMGFLLVLLFSSYITATTWNIGGFLILRHLFSSNISTWVHHLIVKALTVILVFFFAKGSGSEGTYQLLIFCQVVQAMLLPSSVIPLLRVASARTIMGTFRLSWYLEVLALLVFLGVTALNVIFISEMSFGNSSWVQNIREGLGDTKMPLYTALLVVGFVLICFTLYLVVTPLKSASISDSELLTLHSGKDQRELPEEIQDGIIDKVTNYDNHMRPVELPVESSVESRHEELILESNIDQSVTVADSDDRCEQSINELSVAFPATVPTDHAEELISVCDADLENMDEVSPSVHSLHSRDELSTEPKNAVEKDLEVRVATKENEEHISTEEPYMGSLPVSNVKELGASNVVKEKCLDCGSGIGSISKFPGLGRGTRVKVAGILNEFWEHLFDYHGKITQEANGRKFDVLLGLDLKVASPSMKVDAATQSYKEFLADTDRRTALQQKSMEYNSPIQENFSNLKPAYGIQQGSPSWSQSMRAFNTQGQSSSIGQFEFSDRINSAINLPQYADNRDYQPATIHGYQLASYLKGINGGRSPFSSSMSIDPLATSKSSASFSPNMRDSLLYANRLNELNLLGKTGLQSPTLSQVNRVPLEGNYYAPSLIESANIGTSAYTKKYHSSPDVSALIAASRKALLNEATWGGPIGTRPSSVMVTSGQPQSLSFASRTDVPLAFDELSPPQFQRDVFSHQSNINPDTRSLWSRQPFEQFYGTMDRVSAKRATAEKPSNVSQELFSYVESESRLLQYLRFCIMELQKLDGSDWLFRQKGGCDEGLIDQLAETEKYLRGSDSTELSQVYSVQHRNDSAGVPFTLKVPNCGDSCTWRASLIISFGVWCVRRILELSLAESRPDLWGKYTYVLNRLQGVLDLAFLKPRRALTTCSCLEIPPKESDNFIQSQQAALLSKAGTGSFTTAVMILDIIKDVELAVSGRKGRSGTAAGDIAFPKGKENLASVLKRYKRRLSNKSQGAQEGSSSRKAP